MEPRDRRAWVEVGRHQTCVTVTGPGEPNACRKPSNIGSLYVLVSGLHAAAHSAASCRSSHDGNNLFTSTQLWFAYNISHGQEQRRRLYVADCGTPRKTTLLSSSSADLNQLSRSRYEPTAGFEPALCHLQGGCFSQLSYVGTRFQYKRELSARRFNPDQWVLLLKWPLPRRGASARSCWSSSPSIEGSIRSRKRMAVRA